jgi:ribosomal protein S7
LNLSQAHNLGQLDGKRLIDDCTLLHHLSALLTRHGKRGDSIVAEVNHQLRVKYQVSDPISQAIMALRPIVAYKRGGPSRRFVPQAQIPHSANSIALRWVIDAANKRSYEGGRPQLLRGLVDELDAVINGSSSLYAKKFQMHRNPN